MKQYSKRQEAILSFIQQQEKATNQLLLSAVKTHFDTASRITLVRDLNELIKKGFIKRHGKGRGVWYSSSIPVLLRDINIERYFEEDLDLRVIQKQKIDFLKNARFFHGLFSQKEQEALNRLNKAYIARLKSYPPQAFQKELERITIEFSWKSSRIEGNTYSLLDTERLIKNNEEAKGHTHEEALMIVNHKAALDYVFAHPRHFQTISLRNIEEIHSLLIKGMNVSKGIRKRPVRITGTAYIPYNNQFQIREMVEDLCHLLNSLQDPFLKALIGIAGISYIQPFEDGNKRTSRLIGNAILLAHHCCPLSYRSVDEVEYKEAMILFYEQHSLVFFKKLFMEQFEFAVQNYFL